MADISDIFADFAGGLPVVGSVIRGAKAREQIEEGKRLKNSLVRPTYRTPGEILEATQVAKSAFLDPRMPGQSTTENRIQGNTSQAIGLARSVGTNPNSIIAGIVGANENQNKAFTDLADSAAEQQLKDQENYQRALATLGEYRDKEFNINEYNPYAENSQRAEDMIGAGNKNLDTAQKDFGSEATQIALAIATGGASLGMGGLGKGGQSDPSSVMSNYSYGFGQGNLPAAGNARKGLKYTPPIYMRPR